MLRKQALEIEMQSFFLFVFFFSFLKVQYSSTNGSANLIFPSLEKSRSSVLNLMR